MKYILERYGKIFFESDSFIELKDTFERLIGELSINYMNEGKEYNVFCCQDGYALLIKK